MEIIRIKRIISDREFGNVQATATISEGENVIEQIKKLDATLRESLQAISEHRDVVEEKRREKSNAISLLTSALEYAERTEIPF